MKKVSEDIGRFYQHYPKLAVVVTARSGEKSNGMSAAWHTALSYAPPLYGVSISPKRFTYQLISESKEFAVNFLSFDKAELIASLGGSSGHAVAKFKKLNIKLEKSLKTQAPVLEAAYAAFECRLLDDKPYGDHNWLTGQVVAIHLQEDALIKDVINLDKISPSLYMGRELYLTTAKETVKFFDREVYGKI